MKPRLALVAALPLRHRCPLSRIPGLTERLGPVAASSPSLAARWVRVLRAGHPVRNYKGLEESRTVLVCAPDPMVRPLAAELASSGLDWRRRIVLLCGSTLASTELAPLAARGAATGSISALAGLEELGVILEGDPAAVREARQLLRHSRLKLYALETSRKSACLAGVSFATTLLAPLLDASVECLRHAGFKSGVAAVLAGELFRRTLSNHAPPVKKPRGLREDAEPLRRQAEALRRLDPVLTRYFCQSVAAATELGGAPASPFMRQAAR